jgi:hypothetical protein
MRCCVPEYRYRRHWSRCRCPAMILGAFSFQNLVRFKLRLTDICKKISFYFFKLFENVLFFEHMHVIIVFCQGRLAIVWLSQSPAWVEHSSSLCKISHRNRRPNSWTQLGQKSQKSLEFSSLLFTTAWFEAGSNVNVVYRNLSSEILKIMRRNLNEIVRS